MAQGQKASKTITLNNTPTSTVTKTVELVVVGNQLVPENNEINHGVNTKNLKN